MKTTMGDRDCDRRRILNVPNVLTMLRLALIPVFAVLFMNGRMIPALAVYIAASLTDIADGYIARKYRMITDFGKLMDPLADKLMVITMMVLMVLKGIIPLILVILLAAKELLMVLGGLFLLGKGKVVFSAWIGKIAQLLLVIGLILCFFTDRFGMWGLPAQLHVTVLWCGTVLAYAALCYYALSAFRAYRAQNLNHSAN